MGKITVRRINVDGTFNDFEVENDAFVIGDLIEARAYLTLVRSRNWPSTKGTGHKLTIACHEGPQGMIKDRGVNWIASLILEQPIYGAVLLIGESRNRDEFVSFFSPYK